MCTLAEGVDRLLLEMWSKIALVPFEERRFTPPYPIQDQTAFEVRQSLVYFEFELIMVILGCFMQFLTHL